MKVPQEVRDYMKAIGAKGLAKRKGKGGAGYTLSKERAQAMVAAREAKKRKK